MQRKPTVSSDQFQASDTEALLLDSKESVLNQREKFTPRIQTRQRADTSATKESSNDELIKSPVVNNNEDKNLSNQIDRKAQLEEKFKKYEQQQMPGTTKLEKIVSHGSDEFESQIIKNQIADQLKIKCSAIKGQHQDDMIFEEDSEMHSSNLNQTQNQTNMTKSDKSGRVGFERGQIRGGASSTTRSADLEEEQKVTISEMNFNMSNSDFNDLQSQYMQFNKNNNSTHFSLEKVKTINQDLQKFEIQRDYDPLSKDLAFMMQPTLSKQASQPFPQMRMQLQPMNN